MTSRKARSKKEPEVLSAAYLEGTGNKNELLRRLTNITASLSDLSEEIDPTSHPGLLSLSTALVSPSILENKDKEVRLHAVLAACEIFYIYAPEPPWEEGEILQIFGQLIRQLGCLVNTSPESNNFESYFRILEQLSEVKIGVVLVDLIRTERGGTQEDTGDLSALETLCELIRTLLNCVHVDHPPEVVAHAEMAVSACIEEFEGSVPIQVLEELLTCVGSGPVVWVTNPAFAALKKKKSPRTPGSSGKKGEEDLPPPQIQQTNPSYLVAAKVLRRTEDKISSPIAALLNGLLTGDPNVMEKTSLSTVDAEAAQLLSPKSSGKKKRKGSAEKDESPTLATHLEATKDTNTGANVYSISYELHRIAPQILTTVIGTVSTSLVNQDLTKRWQATKLLGRLFGARSSDIASRFGPCFREWLRRSYDPEPKVRETMVKCLVNFLTTQYSEGDLCADVNEALATIIIRDPTLDIRLLGIHQVCDLAHTATVSGTEPANATNDGTSSSKRAHPISVITSELLLAIGNRVSSKNKMEHKDAITGLAQIYHKHYLRLKLKFVQEGGDDVCIDEILDVWKDTKSASKENAAEEEKFAWIPQKVFECVSFADAEDPEMRNRIFQIVDDVLLGSAKSKDSTSGSTLTPTSRAAGLALIVNSVKEKENAFKWMCTLFNQRSHLQKALGAYLDARSKAKECKSKSAEAVMADSEAKEKLELVASLSAPTPESSGGPGKSPGASADQEAILKKVHAAKDKHIFRILSTICSSAHSPSARIRAFDELPKRTKSLGTAAQAWIKILARRCAMGAFVNAENVEHCIILSQECFEAEDCDASAGFLECVKLGTSTFPALGSTKEGFKNLVEFFDASRAKDLSSSVKRDMKTFGVVTALSEILARSGTASASRGPSSGKKGSKGDKESDEDMNFGEDGKNSYDTLREQLLRLCTRDGTPEQARNSVYTISSMIQPPQSTSGEASNIASRVRKEKKEFEPLLKALVNPSRLTIPDDTTSPKSRGRIISVLSAISAIADCAPHAFNARGQGAKLGWGQRALQFCLDTVLLGKNARLSLSQYADDEETRDSEEDLSPTKKGRGKGGKKGKNGVSVHCQMLCGAVEVLVSHIRSTIVNSQPSNNSKSSKKRRSSSDGESPKLKPPSHEHLTQVFSTLIQILSDGGVPPSSVDGRYCKTAKDKAELRRTASVNILRLCDANLRLEGKSLEATYLTPKMWHVLSSGLVDDNKGARSSFMEELSHMFTASGKFRAAGGAQVAPSLRFVSLVTLCADGDAHGAAHSGANVGHKASNGVKKAATSCIKQLRTTCQTAQAQCRSTGRSAEKHFESRLKMKLMPEYCVPYALHLLAFRHETGSVAGTLAGENDSDEDVEESSEVGEEMVQSQEASQKMLKKRMKWLFDPLVQSLGAGADNISFLLRMVELLSKHPPTNVLRDSTDSAMPSLDLGDEEDNVEENKHDTDEKEAEARMKIICQFAREVLLGHVKKDVNLNVYPGSIQIPGDLYRARPSSPTVKKMYESEESEEEEEAVGKKRRPKKSISHYIKKSEDDEMSLDDQSDDDEDGKSEVSDDEFEEKKVAPSKRKTRRSIEKSNEVKEKSNEDGSDDAMSGSTYEHSPEKSADDKPEKTAEQLTYEHSPFEQSPASDHSPSFSPTAAALPLSSEDGFDKEFGDVSPISKAEDSPKVDSAPRVGRRKKSSSSAQAPAKSRTSAEAKKSKTSNTTFTQDKKSRVSDKKLSSRVQVHKSKTSGKKRKSSDIDVFDEYPSPATDSAGSPLVSQNGSTKKPKPASSRASKSGGKKSPILIPKSVMINVTNSAASSGSSSTAVAVSSKKKRAMKKNSTTKKKHKESLEMEKDNDFDFSHAAIKPKVKAKSKSEGRGKSQAPASGRSKKKSASSEAVSSTKKSPARKARPPVKAKVSGGKAKVTTAKAVKASAGKAKVTTAKAVKASAGKAKASATGKKAAGKKTPTSGRGKTAPEGASPSTTSEASSRASPLRRGSRRSARVSKA